MKSIEVSARTVEDAISEGLIKLNCSISDCKVDVLREGAKGLFGFFGSKPASVRLTLVTDEEESDGLGFDLSSSLDEPQQKPYREQPIERQPPKERAPVTTAAQTLSVKMPAPEKPKTQQAATAEKPIAQAKPAVEKTKAQIAPAPAKTKSQPAPDKPGKPKNADVLERFKSAPLPGQPKEVVPAKNVQQKSSEQPLQPVRQHVQPVRQHAQPVRQPHLEEPDYDDREMQERVPVPAPEHIEMHAPDTIQGRAQQYLLGLTERMGVTVQVEAHCNEEGHLFATMYGDTLGILIGRRGETLDALQYLTSLQINKGQEEYIRVTLDTENYRAKREEALTRLAARMANRAVKTGRKVSLEPMNPYERRILHASLQGNPNVSTHSEGDEPYRHVVVVPEK